jgi:hypothetical protein
MARASLVRVEVGGWAAELWMAEADVDRLREARVDDGFVLLPFRDNYLGFRRGLDGLLDPALRGRPVAGWENAAATVGDVVSLHHHVVLERGRIAGIWEYDPAEEAIVCGAFSKLSAAQNKALAAAAERLAVFVRDELGDVKFYVLDNEKNRAGRLRAVRAL